MPKYLEIHQIKQLPDFPDFWDNWVEQKEDKLGYWQHIKSWWQARSFPNVLLVHYDNLLQNKSPEIERISRFLNLEINWEIKETILEKTSLEYMKLNWQKFQPPKVFKPNTFINKGVKGRWQDLLTAEQVKKYEIIMSENLEPECANWVKNAGVLPKVK